ncbi:MAG: large terminase protein [Caudoviricetes sp.]|nr:MAG: large terminase protein [Caudoviricetes sp.]
MENKFIKNTLNLKILTDEGYKNFAGISLMGYEDIYKLSLENDLYIECSRKHKVLTSNFEKVSVCDLKVGDLVKTEYGNKKVISCIKTDKKEPVYDLIEVDGIHRYYTNNILSSNCEFISSDETLIDSTYISDKMKSKNEIFTIEKNVRWFKEPEANHVYAISLDPSMGTGGDPAAIEVFDLTTLEQVAEWKDNQTSSINQVKLIRTILLFLHTSMVDDPNQKGEPEIYWSYENNANGEGTLVAIELTGLENFPGTLLSDKKGGRTGLHTTNSSKMTACSVFKRLVEKNKLKIYSAPLIAELKNFVASGAGYKAKIGEHDDLVMTTLGIIRIYNMISKWEDNVAREDDIVDDITEIEITPLPVAFL